MAVEYSTLNYKDGLVLTTGGGLVRTWPHVGGIDLAGTVETSDNSAFRPGDRVVLNGWRVGELHWGGYATKARVKGDWLVKLPQSISTRRAMAIGTAGYTSMLCVLALEKHGTGPAAGEVLVTGAAGGVGSVAVAILAKLGYTVVAATGRPEEGDYLKSLGAATIMPRKELVEAPDRPLLSERFAGVVDTVSGVMLAKALAQVKYAGAAAVCGLAGGATFPGSILPFILRGVTMYGIDSVMLAQGAARGRLAPPRDRPAARQARRHGERGGPHRPDDARSEDPQGRDPRPRRGRREEVNSYAGSAPLRGAHGQYDRQEERHGVARSRPLTPPSPYDGDTSPRAARGGSCSPNIPQCRMKGARGRGCGVLLG